jgi:hypothetical protein
MRNMEIVAERLRGETARFDISRQGSGKVIVAKDKRITVKPYA